MILPSDEFSLLLLADYLEEYGSSFDIVKSTAIRNNSYNLGREEDYELEMGYGMGNASGEGSSSYSQEGLGMGNGFGSPIHYCRRFYYNENGEGFGNADGWRGKEEMTYLSYNDTSE